MKLGIMFKKISEKVDALIMKIVFITIVAMIISITMQIAFRVFADALTWTEEITRYLLVWSTFLGTTLAYKRGMHISVTFGIDLLKESMRKWFVVLNIIVSIVFFVVVIRFGFKYMGMQTMQVSAALRMPMRWVYSVIPFSFTVMTLHGVSAIFEEIYKEGKME